MEIKRWPPRLPEEGRMSEALSSLTEIAQEDVQEENLSPDDQKVINVMNPGNTMIRLDLFRPPHKKTRLRLFLEIYKRRMESAVFNILRQSPEGDDFYVLPTKITHRAIKKLRKDLAVILANTVIRDFFDNQIERRQAYEDANISLPTRTRELMDPAHWDKKLREIYLHIRERSLPLFSL